MDKLHSQLGVLGEGEGTKLVTEVTEDGVKGVIEGVGGGGFR